MPQIPPPKPIVVTNKLLKEARKGLKLQPPAPELRYEQHRDPIAYGVYACRVPIGGASHLCEDQFLQWYENRWWYLDSDQGYRGLVVGWLGPLPRLNDDDDIPF